jgi:hypothetical protein
LLDSGSRAEGLVRGRLLYGIAAVSFLVWASLFPTIFHRLTCPFQVQQEEAANLEFGRILLAGEPLYRDIRQEGPYLHPYPPLYPTILSCFMRVVPGLWMPGRLPAFLGYLACGFLLAGWGRKRWDPPVTFAVLGLFLISPTWLSWGTMARMDSLLGLVNFSAFLILYSMDSSQRKISPRKELGSWAAAGFINSLGLMMKSSACTFTFAGLGLALWKRKWKEAGVFLGALLLPYALNSLYWQYKSQGNYLLFLKWQAGGLYLSSLWFFLTTSFARECGWMLVAVLWLIGKGRLSPLLVLQLLFSLLWFLVAACQPTSAENHYMEFLLFGFFALGEGLSLKSPPAEGTQTVAMVLLAAALVLYAMAPAPQVPGMEEMQAKSQMLPLYEKPGDYLAIDVDLPYMAGRRIWYLYSGLMPFYYQGIWNPAPMVRDVKARKFLSIEVYDQPRQTLLPPPVMEAVVKNYRIGFKAYGRAWYVPLELSRR